MFKSEHIKLLSGLLDLNLKVIFVNSNANFIFRLLYALNDC